MSAIEVPHKLIIHFRRHVPITSSALLCVDFLPPVFPTLLRNKLNALIALAFLYSRQSVLGSTFFALFEERDLGSRGIEID